MPTITHWPPSNCTRRRQSRSPASWAGRRRRRTVASRPPTRFSPSTATCRHPELVAHLNERGARKVFVCGVQADTCVLAAGFTLFDAGLNPTLIADLVAGSSLDRGGKLGVRLWRHHFGAAVESHRALLPGVAGE